MAREDVKLVLMLAEYKRRREEREYNSLHDLIDDGYDYKAEAEFENRADFYEHDAPAEMDDDAIERMLDDRARARDVGEEFNS